MSETPEKREDGPGAALPPIGSDPLLPNEHMRMLIEMMRPTGPELSRRWLAALMLVPRDQREAVVASVEQRVVEEFGDRAEQGA